MGAFIEGGAYGLVGSAVTIFTLWFFGELK